jgi:hypothetical protein
MVGVASMRPVRSDVDPATHEIRDRGITGIVTVVPFIGLAVAFWQSWEGLLRASDLIVFAILYTATGLGGARVGALAGRSLSARHPRAGAGRPRLGRRPPKPRAPGVEAPLPSSCTQVGGPRSSGGL